MFTNNPFESKAKNITLWLLQVLVALTFFGSGFGKLSSQPPMVETFTQIGMGQWLRYVTGGIEVIAAVLLFIPRLVPVGSLLLVLTMAGAVLTHVAKIGGNPAPALVLMLLAAAITLAPSALPSTTPSLSRALISSTDFTKESTVPSGTM